MLSNIEQPIKKKNADILIEQVGDTINKFKKVAAPEVKSISGISFGVPGFINGDSVTLITYGLVELMEVYLLKMIIENEFSLPGLMDIDARIV